MKMNRNRRSRNAFTLMEVLLVLVILATLASMVGIGLRGAQKRAKVDEARAQMGSFKSAIDRYQLYVNQYPTTEQGLQALLEAPSDLPNPEKWGNDPYLDATRIPLDPWDNPYQYEADGSRFRIWSYGPDGVDGTEDDVASDDET